MMKRLLTSALVFAIALVSAYTVLPTSTAMAGACDGQASIFPRWYDDLCGPDKKSVMSPDKMGRTGGTAEDTAGNLGLWLGVIAMNIVKMILMVVGYVSLGYIIYGGFKYMISGDSSAGTVAARKTIQNAVIGLVLSIMSVSIINLVTGAIT